MLVASDDRYNRGRTGLIVVLPVTSTIRNVPLHIRIDPPDGGLRVASTILCDQVRSLARERFVHRLGRVTDPTMNLVEERLRDLFHL